MGSVILAIVDSMIKAIYERMVDPLDGFSCRLQILHAFILKGHHRAF